MSSVFSKQSRLGRKLVKAATKGDIERVKKLLAEGADVNYKPWGANPPLFSAVYFGSSEGHLAVLRLLLEKGATVDLPNGGGYSALMGAANKGHVAAMKILLAAGADPHLAPDGRDALYWAKIGGVSEAIALVLPPPPAPVSIPIPAPAPHVDNSAEITLTRALGNRVMEEIFDFHAKERITLIRNGADGPVEAVTREGFADVKDRARLREAFDAYVKKGGEAEEAAIFPEQLIKPRTAKLPGATP